MKLTGPMLREVANARHVRAELYARLNDILWDYPIDMEQVKKDFAFQLTEQNGTLFHPGTPCKDIRHDKRREEHVLESWSRWRGPWCMWVMPRFTAPTPELIERGARVTINNRWGKRENIRCVEQPLHWPVFSPEPNGYWWVACSAIVFHYHTEDTCPTCGHVSNRQNTGSELDFVATIVGCNKHAVHTGWYVYAHDKTSM